MTQLKFIWLSRSC